MSKSITLDDEAYRILKSHKLEDESFSDVVKKHMAEALVGPALVEALEKDFAELKRKSRKQHATAGR